MRSKKTFERKRRNTDLTTGQVAAILHVSTQSLFYYVRNFRQYFSESAGQRTQGRHWTVEDLELVQLIRSLYHERAGTEKIHELLSSGWRLQNTQLWTRELITILLDETLTAQEEARDSAGEVITLKRILEERKRNNDEFQKMWIRLGDLENEWKITQKALKLRGVIVEATRKKYHGELPDLYSPGGKNP